MYIWKVNALVEDLKADRVTSKEQFKYCLFFSVMFVIVTTPSLHQGRVHSYLDAILFVLLVIITIVGIYYCYNINKKGDDRDFLVRIVCLSIPVTLRLMVIFILFMTVITVFGLDVFKYSEGHEMHALSMPGFILELLLQIVYYVYLGSMIRKTAF